MVSAKPWRAAWEDSAIPTNGAQKRAMTLEAPELPAGTALQFDVTANVLPTSRSAKVSVSGTSGAGTAEEPFDGWSIRGLPSYSGILNSIQELPKVQFSFAVEGGGRLVSTKAPLDYSDAVEVKFTETDGGAGIKQARAVIHTPWGKVTVRTDDEGVVRLDGLPPGGVHVVLAGGRLVDPGGESTAGGEPGEEIPRRKTSLRLMDLDSTPLSHVEYTITAEAFVLQGTTAEDGLVEERLPVSATEALLQFEGFELVVMLGALADAQQPLGIKQRLSNLGYEPGDLEGSLGEQAQAAGLKFRRDQRLGEPAQGQPSLDSTTISKLQDIHGS
jgi:hypothetical protein